MSAKPITRRDFLKAGCLTLTAAGTAVCGFSLVIPIPKDNEIILLKGISKGGVIPIGDNRIIPTGDIGIGKGIYALVVESLATPGSIVIPNLYNDLASLQQLAGIINKEKISYFQNREDLIRHIVTGIDSAARYD